MDSYKRFLDLNAGDAALRAEALRRLGDLNLESSESERIERELVTNEGLRATEAIHLYSALLKTYPKYERNDSVLYQLARAYELNAQPDKALASLDQLVASIRTATTSTKRSFGAANCCSPTRPIRRRRTPTRRSTPAEEQVARVAWRNDDRRGRTRDRLRRNESRCGLRLYRRRGLHARGRAEPPAWAERPEAAQRQVEERGRNGTRRRGRLSSPLRDRLQHIARLGDVRQVDLGLELVGRCDRRTGAAA